EQRQRRDRQHGLHSLQLARRSSGHLWRAHERIRRVHHRRIGRLRHHHFGNRHDAHVAHTDWLGHLELAMSAVTLMRACHARLRAATGPGSDTGTSLVEAVVATTLLAILMAGVMSLGAVAPTTTENQGHLAARTTEYAQDKMEQLLALAYGDTTSDTRVFPATSTGGTGLTVGGSINTGAPVTGYVDYLDANGNVLASANGAPANWFYMRAWQV